MAYSNLFPTTYQPYQPTYPQYSYPQAQTPLPQPQTNDTGILWVQGEAGAKSWAVAPGKSVMLMDSESSTFYIKSTDASGMPMPLRIFDYTERSQVQQTVQPQAAPMPEIDMSNFVTRDELNTTLQEVNNKFDSLVPQKQSSQRKEKVNNG